MWKAITVGQAVRGSDGISSHECTKEGIREAFKRKHMLQTLNLDLCHASEEREEGPRVLHLQAKRYLGIHPHSSRLQHLGQNISTFPSLGHKPCPSDHDSLRSTPFSEEQRQK